MQDDHSFDNFINKDHPYYDLISQHKDRFHNIFDVLPTDQTKEVIAAFPLKIYCRQNADSNFVSFIQFFTFPITPEKYLSVLQDYEFQKKVDQNIEEFRSYKELSIENTQLLFLSYKRILILMPRYFVYVRYTFKINGDIWIATTSDPQAEEIKGKTKGDILLTVTRIKKVEGGCQISTFSQVDMKMKLKFEMAMNSGIAELAKYLRNLFKMMECK